MNDRSHGLGLRMLVVSGGVLASRVLGLMRDMAFAYVFGTSTALAAFVIANTFPNLLRELFGEGAFSHAMVPVFSTSIEKEGENRAWDGACRVISTLILVVAALTLAGILLALLLRPWFTGELPNLTLTLIPWLLPYAIMVCACAALAAALNSVGRFAVPAYSQTIMNIALIAAAFAPALLPQSDVAKSRAVWFLVAGVLIAGLVQWLVHLRSCGHHLQPFKFQVDFRHPMVGRVARLMAPAMVGVGVMQINIVVDRVLAGWLGALETTSLYYSQRLIYLPVGLFGVAMGIVALPAMSQAWARQQRQDMLTSLDTAFRQVLFLTLPAVALLSALRYPVISLLFERGGFTEESTAATAWAMLFYLPGIPMFACAKIAVTPFYARHDTRTPVRVATLCMGLNLILNLILMQFLRQGGLALATSICSAVNVLTLLILTTRHLGGGVFGKLFKPVAKMTVAAALAYLAAVIVLRQLPPEPTLFARLLQVALPTAAAGAVYLAATLLLACREPWEILGVSRQ